MLCVAVAPLTAAHTEICAKAETAQGRVSPIAQDIAQKITQNTSQSHTLATGQKAAEALLRDWPHANEAVSAYGTFNGRVSYKNDSSFTPWSKDGAILRSGFNGSDPPEQRAPSSTHAMTKLSSPSVVNVEGAPRRSGGAYVVKHHWASGGGR